MPAQKKLDLYVASPLRFCLPHSGNESIEHITFLPPRVDGHCKEHPEVEKGTNIFVSVLFFLHCCSKSLRALHAVQGLLGVDVTVLLLDP